MKDGWNYKQLVDVCDFQGGSQPPKDEWSLELLPGYIRMLQIRDFTQSRSVQPEYIKITNRIKRCEADDIMIGRYGASIGKILTGLAGAYNVALMKTIPDPSLCKPFLKYFLSSNVFQKYLSTIGGRAAQAGFNKDDLKGLQIPVPSLQEQQSIVEYLDSSFAKLDAMKANAEKALNEAKALFKISQTFLLEPQEDWKRNFLTQLGDLKNGMNFNKNESGNSVHILGVGDFGNSFQIDNTDDLPLISLNSKPSLDYILQENDIVFVRSNGNKNLVGRCVLVHVGKEPSSFSGFCIRFRKNSNDIDANYLTHFLKSEASRKKLVGNGANISNLSQKVLNKFEVYYPSLQDQKSIVSSLETLSDKVGQLQSNYDQISKECDALKQALLKQVFE